MARNDDLSGPQAALLAAQKEYTEIARRLARAEAEKAAPAIIKRLKDAAGRLEAAYEQAIDAMPSDAP